MNGKANGIYTDGNVDSLKHSGVQPWSAGAVFPYVVFKRETYTPRGELIEAKWIVSLAGEQLAEVSTHDRAEALAAVFKAENVKDRHDANWAVVSLVAEEMDAELYESKLSTQMSDARQRHDHRVMYGDPDHKPADMSNWGEWTRARNEELHQRDVAERARAAAIYGDVQ